MPRQSLTVGLAGVLVVGGTVALAAPVAAATAIPCAPAGQQIQCTTSDFSQPFQFTVPAGVTSALFSLQGGAGGAGTTDDGSAGRAGGAGGFTETTLTLTPGDVLGIYVGGPGADAQPCTGAGNGNDGGAGGKSGGVITGGQGGDGQSLIPLCGGGGGGGGTFVLPSGAHPGDAASPRAVAGGGGGGSGAGAFGTGAIGGAGGGNISGAAQPGGNGGGADGDANLPHVNGIGDDGADSTGCDTNSPANSGAGSCYGGGGGGGGRFGGGGGAQGAGGGGGSSLPGAGQPSVQSFRETAVGGFATITFTQSPSRPRQDRGGPDRRGGPHDNNDPGFDPSNDPDRRPPGVHPDARTDETICRPEIGRCTVHPPAGPDSVFAVTARGGRRAVVLFGTLMGGARPNCPGYTEVQSDWLQFGFRDRLAGSSWRKSATLTTRHKLSRAAASALSRQMQVCFEAPYAFRTRPGYPMGGHGQIRDGVLPDCTPGLRASARASGAKAPCVSARQVLARKGGWVVQLIFRVPATQQDPKALG